MKSQRKQYVDKKLIIRLRMFAIIFLAMVGIGIYDVSLGNLQIILALAAIIAGIGIGWLVARASNVVWHEEAKKAITKMDVFGIVILIAYISFAVFRRWIFGHWLQGATLSAFIIWFSSGIMLGRLLSIRLMIINVLKRRGL